MLSRCFHFGVFEIFVSSLFLLVLFAFWECWYSALYNSEADSKQFNNEEITPELFKDKLKERLSTADIKQVKEDVLPFMRNPKELDIWSNDYFVQLADMVRIK